MVRRPTARPLARGSPPQLAATDRADSDRWRDRASRPASRSPLWRRLPSGRRASLASARPDCSAAPGGGLSEHCNAQVVRSLVKNPPSSAQRDGDRDHRQSEAQQPKPRRPRVGVDVLRPLVADDEQQPDPSRLDRRSASQGSSMTKSGSTAGSAVANTRQNISMAPMRSSRTRPVCGGSRVCASAARMLR